ncbi:MAG: hypothetical protein H6510_05525 [Acidobacteria bacterium]|nr:hypothetical protein [Acidobacteriota bacterium]
MLLLLLLFQGPTVQELQALLEKSETMQPAGLSEPAGYALQDPLVAALSPTWGQPFGWKAGLTNPVIQQRFGVDHPISGKMFRQRMYLLERKIPLEDLRGHVLELDLIVRIGSDQIMTAESDAELFACLDGWCGFIELPFLAYPPGEKLTGGDLAAINCGFSHGVMGHWYGLPQNALDATGFGAIQADISVGEKVLAQGSVSAMMTHPLIVVRWLRDHAIERGQPLKKGDYLSLGGMAAPMPLPGPGVFLVRYQLGDKLLDSFYLQFK